MLARMWINWIFHTLLVGMYNVTATLEKSLAVSYKTIHVLTQQPRNHTPGHLTPEMKTYVHINCTEMLMVALLQYPKTGNTWNVLQ